MVSGDDDCGDQAKPIVVSGESREAKRLVSCNPLSSNWLGHEILNLGTKVRILPGEPTIKVTYENIPKVSEEREAT